MKIAFKVLVAAMMVFAVVSCQQRPKSKLLNEKITQANLQDLTKKIESDSLMTLEDVQNFSVGITRILGKNDTLVGKTVGQVIDYAKQSDRQLAIQTLMNTSIRAELVQNHTFKYDGINVDNDTLNILVIEVKNNSDKPISNLQGLLQFYNQSNQLVKQYPINTKPQVIQAGENRKIALTYTNDPKNPRDSIMRHNQNMRAVWTAAAIEFGDGSSISVTRNQ